MIKNMTLEILEAKWSEYLSDENCPPVLGLVSLSEEESEVICQLVAREIGQNCQLPWQNLFALLQNFPACLAIWLARKAGEAYESGAFWDKFGSLIGVIIPISQRDELARRFRRACRATMAVWLPPEELRGPTIVGQFLHQAGLPLDRCDSFAQHVRKVERNFGLPDPDSPDAGEQLREAILDSLQPVYVPTLKRALRGPAGSRICEIALNVVLKGDFTGINPRLGQELERVFEHAVRGTLRRSAHQPFLRLGDDFGSLEIVGPRQDMSLVAPGGLTWVVNGQRFPIPRTEEFLLKVTDRPRVILELNGLVLGNLPPRTFVLRLDDLEEPFFLFEERNRRQRRASEFLPAGRYWILHRSADTLIGAEQRYDWSDGERSLSLFEVRPGTEVRLESELGRAWSFSAALIPFFEAVGKLISHETAETVCFGWSEMPFIWLPLEEMDPELFTQWIVRLKEGDIVHDWKLMRTSEESSGMVKCSVTSGNFLSALSPGLHRIELTLRRGERSRVEAQANYWYWQGLIRVDVQNFYLAAAPHNIIQTDCRGFALGNTVIKHLSDQNHRHTLTFDIGDEKKTFHWSQPGVFVESLERRAGQQALPCSHRFGEAFSASLNSDRWLRIWLTGQSGWEIIVAGQSWQRDIGGDRREFVELSLASLATAFPQGGEILLRQNGSEYLLARFTSPLHPVAIEEVCNEVYKGFRFHFAEPIAWIRPTLWELASNKRSTLEGQQFDTSGQCFFNFEDLPQIMCSNIVDENSLGVITGNPVTLQVLYHGWPEGLWLIEIEVRRDENTNWEPVALRGLDYAPVVIISRNSQSASTMRARLLWASYTTSGAQTPEDFTFEDEGCAELLDLLADLITLRQRGTAVPARQNTGWLKNAVRFLSKRAGRIARQVQNDGLQSKLLNLACQDSNHAGFIYLPGLLALPANRYRELPFGDPLNDALRRCSRIAIADSVAEAVRCDYNFLDINVISCFANFRQIAAVPNGEMSTLEFNNFDYDYYWHNVLGILQHDQLVPDWLGEGALGYAHFVYALAELVRGYEHSTHELNYAAANRLLHCAPAFRIWLHKRLANQVLMSQLAWGTPWPRFVAPTVDFLETTPKFASLLALAARTSAAGWLEFDEVLTWIECNVESRWMAEEGIAVLVALAPELFGLLLLFWELIVRTRPHGLVKL